MHVSRNIRAPTHSGNFTLNTLVDHLVEVEGCDIRQIVVRVKEVDAVAWVHLTWNPDKPRKGRGDHKKGGWEGHPAFD
eukprot:49796-Eustigmatos_ZCMA.PRE.2